LLTQPLTERFVEEATVILVDAIQVPLGVISPSVAQPVIAQGDLGRFDIKCGDPGQTFARGQKDMVEVAGLSRAQ